VDARGNACVNGADVDFVAGAPPKPGYIKLVTPDGRLRQVVGDIQFPNGMVINPDGKTMIISEWFAVGSPRSASTPDGGLSGRGVFAEALGPDGICVDGKGAVWVGTGGFSVARVAGGGKVLQRAELGENWAQFAPMFGGPDRRTLFICTAERHKADGAPANLERLATRPRTGEILAIPVEVPSAGAAGSAPRGRRCLSPVQILGG